MKTLPRVNLLTNEHTGKFRDHQHTSYPALALILTVATLLLGVFTVVAQAAVIPGQLADAYKVSAAVFGPPPAVPGVITGPMADQHFGKVSITVAGTCSSGTLVKVLRNDIFGGAIFCDNLGHFSLSVSLFYGRNDLTVELYNTTNVSGPKSKVTTVYCDAVAAAGSARGATQLLLNASNNYRGVNVGETLTWPIEIAGGTPPYALVIDWGDGTSDVTSQAGPGTVEFDHMYRKSGVSVSSAYDIRSKVSDSAGNQAVISLTSIVADEPLRYDTLTLNGAGLVIAWPLLIGTMLALLCFGLGEWHERNTLRGKGMGGFNA